MPPLRLTAPRRTEPQVCEPRGLAFTLLGGFSVRRGSWRPDDAAWERRVAQRLVRFLLLHRNRAISEDEILETFWPERHLDRARRSLHVAISRARRVLDTPDAETIIHTTDRTYRLRLRPGDSVDADEFDAAARAGLAESGIGRTPLLERAASLWKGEPLPEERYTDWAISWRERLTDLHGAVLSSLADESLNRGDPIGAGLRARELVEIDPFNEGAHRRLMVALARSGRRHQAIRQFVACRRVLVEQLGVEPATETQRLQQRILAGEPV